MNEPALSTAEIRAGLAQFLAERAPRSSVRQVVDGPLQEAGYDAGVWRALAEDLQVTAVALPTALGGLGLGQAAHCAVLEELGAVLYPGPARSTALAAHALLVAGADGADGPGAEWVERMAAGRLLATVALPPDGPQAAPALQLHSAGAVVDGRLRMVPDGAAAELIVTAAGTAQGPAVVAVRTDTATRQAVTGVDLTHRYTDVQLTAAPAVVLAPPDATPTVRRIHDLATLAVAAEQAGGARSCLRGAVDYAKLRKQFGRSIGSYQALQHQLAELAVDVEAARALVQHAADRLDGSADGFAALAPLARATASEVFLRAADTLVHVHGGIGFTWEHDAHLFFRRALSTAAWFGTPAQWRAVHAARSSGSLAA